MEQYDSVESFSSAMRQSNPEMPAWGPNTTYSTYARLRPDVVSSVRGAPRPAYTTTDEFLAGLRSVNPGYSTLGDEDVIADLYKKDPVLASAWFDDPDDEETLPDEEARAAAATPEPSEEDKQAARMEMMFGTWVGPAPSRPLEEYESGRKLLELGQKNLDGRAGFFEGLKGTGISKWIPYADVVSTVKDVGTMLQVGKKLQENPGSVTDEEIIDFNYFLQQAKRLDEGGWKALAGDIVRTTIVLWLEIGATLGFGTKIAVGGRVGSATGKAALLTLGRKLREAGANVLAKQTALKEVKRAVTKQVGRKVGKEVVENDARVVASRAALDAAKATLKAVKAEEGAQTVFSRLAARSAAALDDIGAEFADAAGAKGMLGGAQRVGRTMLKEFGQMAAEKVGIAGGGLAAVGAARWAASGLPGALAHTGSKAAVDTLISSAMSGEATTSSEARLRLKNMFEGKEDQRMFAAGLGDMFFEYLSEFSGEMLGGALGTAARGLKLDILGGKAASAGKAGLSRLGLLFEAGKKIGINADYIDDIAGAAAGSARAKATGVLMRSLNALFRPTGAAVGQTPFLKTVWSLGYDGVFEEWLEERFGGFLRGVTGLDGDEHKSYLRNVWESTMPESPDHALAEVVAFSTPLLVNQSMRGLARVLTGSSIDEYAESLGLTNRRSALLAEEQENAAKDFERLILEEAKLSDPVIGARPEAISEMKAKREAAQAEVLRVNAELTTAEQAPAADSPDEAAAGARAARVAALREELKQKEAVLAGIEIPGEKIDARVKEIEEAKKTRPDEVAKVEAVAAAEAAQGEAEPGKRNKKKEKKGAVGPYHARVRNVVRGAMEEVLAGAQGDALTAAPEEVVREQLATVLETKAKTAGLDDATIKRLVTAAKTPKPGVVLTAAYTRASELKREGKKMIVKRIAENYVAPGVLGKMQGLLNQILENVVGVHYYSQEALRAAGLGGEIGGRVEVSSREVAARARVSSAMHRSYKEFESELGRIESRPAGTSTDRQYRSEETEAALEQAAANYAIRLMTFGNVFDYSATLAPHEERALRAIIEHESGRSVMPSTRDPQEVLAQMRTMVKDNWKNMGPTTASGNVLRGGGARWRLYDTKESRNDQYDAAMHLLSLLRGVTIGAVGVQARESLAALGQSLLSALGTPGVATTVAEQLADDGRLGFESAEDASQFLLDFLELVSPKGAVMPSGFANRELVRGTPAITFINDNMRRIMTLLGAESRPAALKAPADGSSAAPVPLDAQDTFLRVYNVDLARGLLVGKLPVDSSGKIRPMSPDEQAMAGRTHDDFMSMLHSVLMFDPASYENPEEWRPDPMLLAIASAQGINLNDPVSIMDFATHMKERLQNLQSARTQTRNFVQPGEFVEVSPEALTQYPELRQGLAIGQRVMMQVVSTPGVELHNEMAKQASGHLELVPVETGVGGYQVVPGSTPVRVHSSEISKGHVQTAPLLSDVYVSVNRATQFMTRRAYLALFPEYAGNELGEPTISFGKPGEQSGDDVFTFVTGATNFAAHTGTLFLTLPGLGRGSDVEDTFEMFGKLGSPGGRGLDIPAKWFDIMQKAVELLDGAASKSSMVPPQIQKRREASLRAAVAVSGLRDQGSWSLAHELFHKMAVLVLADYRLAVDVAGNYSNLFILADEAAGIFKVLGEEEGGKGELTPLQAELVQLYRTYYLTHGATPSILENLKYRHAMPVERPSAAEKRKGTRDKAVSALLDAPREEAHNLPPGRPAIKFGADGKVLEIVVVPKKGFSTQGAARKIIPTQHLGRPVLLKGAALNELGLLYAYAGTTVPERLPKVALSETDRVAAVASGSATEKAVKNLFDAVTARVRVLNETKLRDQLSSVAKTREFLKAAASVEGLPAETGEKVKQLAAADLAVKEAWDALEAAVKADGLVGASPFNAQVGTSELDVLFDRASVLVEADPATLKSPHTRGRSSPLKRSLYNKFLPAKSNTLHAIETEVKKAREGGGKPVKAEKMNLLEEIGYASTFTTALQGMLVAKSAPDPAEFPAIHALWNALRTVAPKDVFPDVHMEVFGEVGAGSGSRGLFTMFDLVVSWRTPGPDGTSVLNVYVVELKSKNYYNVSQLDKVEPGNRISEYVANLVQVEGAKRMVESLAPNAKFVGGMVIYFNRGVASLKEVDFFDPASDESKKLAVTSSTMLNEFGVPLGGGSAEMRTLVAGVMDELLADAAKEAPPAGRSASTPPAESTGSEEKTEVPSDVDSTVKPSSRPAKKGSKSLLSGGAPATLSPIEEKRMQLAGGDRRLLKRASLSMLPGSIGLKDFVSGADYDVKTIRNLSRRLSTALDATLIVAAGRPDPEADSQVAKSQRGRIKELLQLAAKYESAKAPGFFALLRHLVREATNLRENAALGEKEQEEAAARGDSVRAGLSEIAVSVAAREAEALETDAVILATHMFNAATATGTLEETIRSQIGFPQDLLDPVLVALMTGIGSGMLENPGLFSWFLSTVSENKTISPSVKANLVTMYEQFVEMTSSEIALGLVSNNAEAAEALKQVGEAATDSVDATNIMFDSMERAVAEESSDQVSKLNFIMKELIKDSADATRLLDHPEIMELISSREAFDSAMATHRKQWVASLSAGAKSYEPSQNGLASRIIRMLALAKLSFAATTALVNFATRKTTVSLETANLETGNTEQLPGTAGRGAELGVSAYARMPLLLGADTQLRTATGARAESRRVQKALYMLHSALAGAFGEKPVKDTTSVSDLTEFLRGMLLQTVDVPSVNAQGTKGTRTGYLAEEIPASSVLDSIDEVSSMALELLVRALSDINGVREVSGVDPEGVMTLAGALRKESLQARSASSRRKLGLAAVDLLNSWAQTTEAYATAVESDDKKPAGAGSAQQDRAARAFSAHMREPVLRPGATELDLSGAPIQRLAIEALGSVVRSVRSGDSTFLARQWQLQSAVELGVHFLEQAAEKRKQAATTSDETVRAQLIEQARVLELPIKTRMILEAKIGGGSVPLAQLGAKKLEDLYAALGAKMAEAMEAGEDQVWVPLLRTDRKHIYLIQVPSFLVKEQGDLLAKKAADAVSAASDDVKKRKAEAVLADYEVPGRRALSGGWRLVASYVFSEAAMDNVFKNIEFLKRFRHFNTGAPGVLNGEVLQMLHIKKMRVEYDGQAPVVNEAHPELEELFDGQMVLEDAAFFRLAQQLGLDGTSITGLKATSAGWRNENRDSPEISNVKPNITRAFSVDPTVRARAPYAKSSFFRPLMDGLKSGEVPEKYRALAGVVSGAVKIDTTGQPEAFEEIRVPLLEGGKQIGTAVLSARVVHVESSTFMESARIDREARGRRDKINRGTPAALSSDWESVDSSFGAVTMFHKLARMWSELPAVRDALEREAYISAEQITRERRDSDLFELSRADGVTPLSPYLLETFARTHADLGAKALTPQLYRSSGTVAADPGGYMGTRPGKTRNGPIVFRENDASDTRQGAVRLRKAFFAGEPSEEARWAKIMAVLAEALTLSELDPAVTLDEGQRKQMKELRKNLFEESGEILSFAKPLSGMRDPATGVLAKESLEYDFDRDTGDLLVYVERTIENRVPTAPNASHAQGSYRGPVTYALRKAKTRSAVTGNIETTYRAVSGTENLAAVHQAVATEWGSDNDADELRTTWMRPPAGAWLTRQDVANKVDELKSGITEANTSDNVENLLRWLEYYVALDLYIAAGRRTQADVDAAKIDPKWFDDVVVTTLRELSALREDPEKDTEAILSQQLKQPMTDVEALSFRVATTLDSIANLSLRRGSLVFLQDLVSIMLRLDGNWFMSQGTDKFNVGRKLSVGLPAGSSKEARDAEVSAKVMTMVNAVNVVIDMLKAAPRNVLRFAEMPGAFAAWVMGSGMRMNQAREREARETGRVDPAYMARLRNDPASSLGVAQEWVNFLETDPGMQLYFRTAAIAEQNPNIIGPPKVWSGPNGMQAFMLEQWRAENPGKKQEVLEETFRELTANVDVLFRGGEELQELAGVLKVSSTISEIGIYDAVTKRMTLEEIKNSAAYVAEEAKSEATHSGEEAAARLKKAREALRFRIVNPAALAKTRWFDATEGALNLAVEELKRSGPLSSPGIWAYLEEKIRSRQMSRRVVEEFINAAHRSVLSASFFHTLPSACKELILQGTATMLYAKDTAAYTHVEGMTGPSVFLGADGKPVKIAPVSMKYSELSEQASRIRMREAGPEAEAEQADTPEAEPLPGQVSDTEGTGKDSAAVVEIKAPMVRAIAASMNNISDHVIGAFTRVVHEAAQQARRSGNLSPKEYEALSSIDYNRFPRHVRPNLPEFDEESRRRTRPYENIGLLGIRVGGPAGSREATRRARAAIAAALRLGASGSIHAKDIRVVDTTQSDDPRKRAVLTVGREGLDISNLSQDDLLSILAYQNASVFGYPARRYGDATPFAPARVHEESTAFYHAFWRQAKLADPETASRFSRILVASIDWEATRSGVNAALALALADGTDVSTLVSFDPGVDAEKKRQALLLEKVRAAKTGTNSLLAELRVLSYVPPTAWDEARRADDALVRGDYEAAHLATNRILEIYADRARSASEQEYDRDREDEVRRKVESNQQAQVRLPQAIRTAERAEIITRRILQDKLQADILAATRAGVLPLDAGTPGQIQLQSAAARLQEYLGAHMNPYARANLSHLDVAAEVLGTSIAAMAEMYRDNRQAQVETVFLPGLVEAINEIAAQRIPEAAAVLERVARQSGLSAVTAAALRDYPMGRGENYGQGHHSLINVSAFLDESKQMMMSIGGTEYMHEIMQVLDNTKHASKHLIEAAVRTFDAFGEGPDKMFITPWEKTKQGTKRGNKKTEMSVEQSNAGILMRAAIIGAAERSDGVWVEPDSGTGEAELKELIAIGGPRVHTRETRAPDGRKILANRVFVVRKENSEGALWEDRIGQALSASQAAGLVDMWVSRAQDPEVVQAREARNAFLATASEADKAELAMAEVGLTEARRIGYFVIFERGAAGVSQVDRFGPSGEVLSPFVTREAVLRRFQESGLKQLLLDNGRNEGDLSLDVHADNLTRISNRIYSEMMSIHEALVPGFEKPVGFTKNYVRHIFGGLGFETAEHATMRRLVHQMADRLGDKSGFDSLLPAEDLNVTAKSSLQDLRGSKAQKELFESLSDQLDKLLASAGKPRANLLSRHTLAERGTWDKYSYNVAIRRVASRLAVERAVIAGRVDAAFPGEEGQKLASTLAALRYFFAKFEDSEWAPVAGRRQYATYADALLESNGDKAPMITDPTRLVRDSLGSLIEYVAKTVTVNIATMTLDSDGYPVLIPERTEGVESNPSEFEKPLRSVISDGAVRRLIQQLSVRGNVRPDPKKSLNDQLRWLIDNVAPEKESRYAEIPHNLKSVGKLYARKESGASKLIAKMFQKEYSHPIPLPNGYQVDLLKSAQELNLVLKTMSLGWSAFFLTAGLESAIAGTGPGFKSNIVFPLAWQREQYHRMVKFGLSVHRRSIDQAETLAFLTRAGMRLSEPDVSDGSTSALDRWIDRAHDSMLERHGATVAKNVKRGLRWFAMRPFSEWMMQDFFGALKTWAALNQIDELSASQPELTRMGAARSVASTVNNAFGGQNWARYIFATPRTMQLLTLAFFAPNWTLSALNVAGGGALLGALLGNRITDYEAKFILRNWVSMYLIALQLVPNMLQAAIFGLGHALPGDDDDELNDKMLAWNNEHGKGGLLPSIDWTPVARKLPWYKGDPTGKRRIYFRFGKQSYEVINGWVVDPQGTIGRKSSMLVKIVWEQVFGHSPGSPDFLLPFKNVKFMYGLFGSDVGFRGSRAGVLAAKALPMSLSSLVTTPDAAPLSLLAPASKGMSQTRAVQNVESLLRDLAEHAPSEEKYGVLGLTLNKHAFASDFLKAAELNGYDADSIMSSAYGAVSPKYYSKFYEAYTKGDMEDAHDAAKALIRLGATTRGLIQSAKGRQEKTNKPPLTEAEEQALIEAFEGVVPPFLRNLGKEPE